MFKVDFKRAKRTEWFKRRKSEKVKEVSQKFIVKFLIELNDYQNNHPNSLKF